MTKRVGIYLRVSRNEQTVENQRLELMRVAEHRGWTIAGEYADEGISGAKGRDKRPAYDRLRKDALSGKFDLVAAWAIDRLGRSLIDLVGFMDEISKANVDLYLHQQHVDTSTAAGRAFLQMAGVFAEYERATLRDRIYAGLARAKAQGKHCGRPRAKTLNVERRVRDLRAKGYGLVRIGRELGIGTGRCKRILNEAAA
jgi:DNA invertase Pin-like site-specific DNA recombinase